MKTEKSYFDFLMAYRPSKAGVALHATGLRRQMMVPKRFTIGVVSEQCRTQIDSTNSADSSTTSATEI